MHLNVQDHVSVGSETYSERWDHDEDEWGRVFSRTHGRG